MSDGLTGIEHSGTLEIYMPCQLQKAVFHSVCCCCCFFFHHTRLTTMAAVQDKLQLDKLLNPEWVTVLGPTLAAQVTAMF
jgi:hypothetical protein